MPMLEINTNVHIDASFLKTISEAVQKMIEKPMKNIAVHLHPGQVMAFGGTTEPCALVNFSSIGKISKEENIKYVGVITEIMAKAGVPADRMYINFYDLARENVGFNGATFAK